MFQKFVSQHNPSIGPTIIDDGTFALIPSGAILNFPTVPLSYLNFYLDATLSSVASRADFSFAVLADNSRATMNHQLFTYRFNYSAAATSVFALSPLLFRAEMHNAATVPVNISDFDDFEYYPIDCSAASLSDKGSFYSAEGAITLDVLPRFAGAAVYFGILFRYPEILTATKAIVSVSLSQVTKELTVLQPLK